jgi:hypothetical protein
MIVKIIKKLGMLSATLSLAIVLGCWFSDLNSLYYTGAASFTESNSSFYAVFLYNRETRIMMDPIKSSNVESIMMNSEQIRKFLSQSSTSYIARFSFNKGLNKTLGSLNQGIYVLVFNSSDKNQVVNFQLVQKGVEYDLIILSIVLFIFGVSLIVLSSIMFRKLFTGGR